MKHLILTFVLSVAFADPGALLGREECTYGPSYWCSHALHAKECGAIQHCIDTVWTKQQIQPKDTAECSLCKIGIAEVKNMLKQNGSEEHIVKVMTEVCDLMTNPSIKEQCTKFVKGELPLLLTLLKSDLTPEQICATLKLCTGFEDQVEHKKPAAEIQSVKTDKVCTDCTNFFGDVQNMITSNETLDQIEGLLKMTVCAQLGAVQGICNTVVDEFVPQFLQMLGQSVDPDTTCRMIGFCNNNGDIEKALRLRLQMKDMMKKINKKSIGGTEECDMCKSALTEVRTLDQDPTFQGKVVDFMKTELCDKLGGLAAECKDLVNQYSPMIFELLANELDPETVCSFIGFCRTQAVVKSPGISVVHLTKAESVKPLALVPAMPIQKSQSVKTSGVTCEVCKAAMGYLDSVLAKNATIEEIEKAFDQICDKLPGQLRGECTDFIRQYAQAVIQLLVQGIEPTVVCDYLNLCTPLPKSMPIQQTQPVKTSGLTCDMCKAVMGYLDKVLARSATQEEIQKALDQVCDQLPGQMKDQCTDFVNKYAKAIIQAFEVGIEPTMVCDFLNLCTPQTKKVKASPQCVLCEFVMDKVESILAQNKSQAAVKSALEKVCSYFPTTITAECKQFVDQYEPLILSLLLNDLKPEQVCKALGLCNSTVAAVPVGSVLLRGEPMAQKQPIRTLPESVSGILLQGSPVVNNNKPIKGTDETCLICETILNYLAEALKENSTRETVKGLLNKACEVLPKSLADECEGIVIAFGDTIINALASELDPKQLCTDLGLCTAKKIVTLKKPTLVKEEMKNLINDRKKVQDSKLYFRPRHEKFGEKKCTYGPSYWCKSMDTAKECGMVIHCRNNVWSKNTRK